MKTDEINLLSTYQQEQRWNRYQKWGFLSLLCVILIGIMNAYLFIFKPQVTQLLQSETKTEALQLQIEQLMQQEEKMEILPEETPPQNIPSGYISIQQENVDLRSVLQQIAASAGVNIILHESVQGTVSVSFNDLLWEQALQVVLDLADLAVDQQDNIFIIRSEAEQIKKTQAALENQQQYNALIPVETILLPIHYAKAKALAQLLMQGDEPWLSTRGVVSVDERTNTLLIRDIPEYLPAVQAMIQRLDMPVRQVAIEARILNVEESFSQELGLLWEVDGNANLSHSSVSQAGNGQPLDKMRMNLPGMNMNHQAMNLAVTSLSSDILLNLELRALESENLVEELAHPRLITADQQTAIIRQGEEIPYQQSAEYGASTISFKPAVLELQVTPHITPDDHIMMKLIVKNDSRGATSLADDVPVITTKEIRTQVLVANGETIVLGGIYTQGSNQDIERLPFFGNLPGIGRLFTNEARQNQRKELLVFVTPRIVEAS